MMVAPDQITQIHEPDKDEAKKPRRKMLFFDRIKLLIVLATYLGFGVTLKHANVPIMGWGEAIRDQLRAKTWVLWIAAVEVLRQMHYLISERSGSYHDFWSNRLFGGWDRWWTKRNPWFRYRMQRLAKVSFWVFVMTTIFSSIWGLSFIDTIAQAPRHLLYNPFGSSGMPWFFQILFGMFYAVIQFVAIFWFMSRGGVDTYMPEQIKTRFSDVWGQDKVLERVKENIVFLDKPDEIEAKGGFVPGGILLWGPPGTGKTLIAEAIAGETSRPFVFVDPGSFKAMFVGVGILKVRGLYKKLRKLSLKYGGVIVFFDEADTLGNRGGSVDGSFNNASPSHDGCNAHAYVSDRTREMLAHAAFDAASTPVDDQRRASGIRGIMMGGMGGMDGTLQAMLTAMSGLKKPKGGFWRWVRSFLSMPPKPPPKYRILHIMATNLPEALDPALLRPGRLDRKYQVNYPQLDGRIKTFEGYFKKVRHNLTAEQVERLALISPRISGAATKDIVNESLIAALKKGRDYITWPDVIEARVFKVYGMSDGVASTRLQQYEVAVHEACHAVAMHRLRTRETIDIATIEKRGATGGFVAPVPIEERDFGWRYEMEDDVMTFLASLAGERLFFDSDNSQGVGGDLGSSTAMVTDMLTRWGMGESISAPRWWADKEGPSRRNRVDERVEAKLQELYERVELLLTENRWFVLAIAHALVSRKTITGEDIRAIDENVVGPTVDGTWYHSAANREAIEVFHTAALAAHKTQQPHFNLDVPHMPALGLPPPPPSAVAVAAP
jgi:cell division protease FtsH